MKIGLFDLDNTMAGYSIRMIECLNQIRSHHEEPIDYVDFQSHDTWLLARMELIKKTPGWWLSLPPLELGFKIYEIARDIGFDVSILTKGPRSKSRAWMEKVEWVNKHLGSRVDIDIVSGKGRTYGTFLCDDYPKYISSWLEYRPRGLVLMPAHRYNKDFKHPNVIRCDGTNYEEIRKALQETYNRT